MARRTVLVPLPDTLSASCVATPRVSADRAYWTAASEVPRKSSEPRDTSEPSVPKGMTYRFIWSNWICTEQGSRRPGPVLGRTSPWTGPPVSRAGCPLGRSENSGGLKSNPGRSNLPEFGQLDSFDLYFPVISPGRIQISSFGLSSANYSNQHYQEIAFQHHHRYSHRHILRGRLDDVDDDIHREGTRKPPPARR